MPKKPAHQAPGMFWVNDYRKVTPSHRIIGWLATALCLCLGVACWFPASALASAGISSARQLSGTMDAFYQQRLAWSPCRGPAPLPTLQCARVIVPLDYQKTEGKRLSIAVSRRPATEPAMRRGILLINPGGPGGSGLAMPAVLADTPPAGAYDLIGFDPRGVGESIPQLLCEATPRLPVYPTRPTDAELTAIANDAYSAEKGCEETDSTIRSFINTANSARDMDIIRAALGEQKISYLGFSYGTYLGAVYGSLFPSHLDRSVLDSSVNPAWIWRSEFEHQAIAMRQQVDTWMEWVAERNGTYHLGRTYRQVLAASEALRAALNQQPVNGITGDDLDLAYGQDAPYRMFWDEMARVVAGLRQDVAAGRLTTSVAEAARLFVGLARNLAAQDLPGLQATDQTIPGVFQTVPCEQPWPSDLAIYYRDMRLFRVLYPYGGGVYDAAPWYCTFWRYQPPAQIVDLERTGYPAGLVVQSQADTVTPYAGGVIMAQRLRDALVTVVDEGEHTTYTRNACVDSIVDAYLVAGVTPSARSACPGTPRPDVPPDNGSPATAQRPASAPAPLPAEVSRLIGQYRLNSPDDF